MKLSAYTELIKNLPYKNQAFETSKETWNRNEFKKTKSFLNFYEKTFKDSNTIILSRGNLFEIVHEGDFYNSVFSIIFWGYSKGYTRPNTATSLFPKFLEKGLIQLQSELQPNNNYTVKELKHMLSNIDGVGMSTLTKFLYFFNCSVDGNQCLILDNRIKKVLKGKRFDELKDFMIKPKQEEMYDTYLQLMKEIAEKQGFQNDQLELFLFMFGNNLKSA